MPWNAFDDEDDQEDLWRTSEEEEDDEDEKEESDEDERKEGEECEKGEEEVDYSTSMAHGKDDVMESKEVEFTLVRGKALLDEIDAGAEADDEDAEDDCELEEILVGEMPAEEIGEGESKAAKKI